MAVCQDTNNFFHDEKVPNYREPNYYAKEHRITADWGVGLHYIRHSGCGYRPLGIVEQGFDGGYVNYTIQDKVNNYGDAGYRYGGNIATLSIHPSEEIYPRWHPETNSWNDLTGMYASDWANVNYGNLDGRWNKPYYGLGALYDWTPAYIKGLDAQAIVRYPLVIGEDLLYRYVNWYGGISGNACCFDQLTGAINTTRSGSTVRQTYAYGNWRRDLLPDYLKYADHVTVHTDGQYGIGNHFSYFRSASILYNNVIDPNDVSESDAEVYNGNLVFEFGWNWGAWTKENWVKLCEVETWPVDRMYSTTTNGTWMGGSRCTLYAKMTDDGLVIGASGEFGGMSEDQATIPYYGNNKNLSFSQDPKSTTSGVSFLGHGVVVKARIVDTGEMASVWKSFLPM